MVYLGCAVMSFIGFWFMIHWIMAIVACCVVLAIAILKYINLV
jgi:hypothetical protein